MLQTNQQDQNPQNQINEEEMGNLHEKNIQSYDSKDGSKSQKQNGGTN